MNDVCRTKITPIPFEKIGVLKMKSAHDGLGRGGASHMLRKAFRSLFFSLVTLVAVGCDDSADGLRPEVSVAEVSLGEAVDSPAMGSCTIQCGEGEQQVFEGENPMCACSSIALAGTAEDVEAALSDAVQLKAATDPNASWGACDIVCGGNNKLYCYYSGFCPRCKCGPAMCYTGSNC